MGIIVQKYGGSSVATVEKINNVARRVLATKQAGHKVVVVVSAMGDTTDELISLAERISKIPPDREMDMLMATGEQVSSALLAIALHNLGQPAISLTGEQAGIITSDVHRKGRILDINPRRILHELAKGQVVVVAGFQGINYHNDVVTLGRGGSDTTAVALAAALAADLCEIYTDVDGVYTADPRVVSDARKLPEVSYDEMLEMARLGAVVLQPRSVEVAKQHGLVVCVRSSLNEHPGTIVKEACDMEKAFVISGVNHDTNVAKLAILGVPDRPGVAYKIFSALADDHIDVDMIVQSIRNASENINDIVFTVSQSDLPRAETIIKALVKEMDALGMVSDSDVAKVSIVGAGMISNPGIAAKMFGALAEAGINIEVISTSEISVSCLIRAAHVQDAVVAIHKKFFAAK